MCAAAHTHTHIPSFYFSLTLSHNQNNLDFNDLTFKNYFIFFSLLCIRFHIVFCAFFPTIVQTINWNSTVPECALWNHLDVAQKILSSASRTAQNDAISANHLCNDSVVVGFIFFFVFVLLPVLVNRRFHIIFLRADARVIFCSCLLFSIASYATLFFYCCCFTSVNTFATWLWLAWFHNSTE